MARTYGQAITVLLDECIRGQEHSARTREAIVDAIDFYKTKRFGFNTTTVSLSWSVSDIQALPTDWLATGRVRVLDASYRAPLTPRTVEYLDHVERALAGTSTGDITDYAIQDRTIRVYPYPDTDYQVAFSYVKDLPEVSISAAETATNAWLGEAWPLIKARSLVDLWENYFQGEESDAKADRNRLREREWLQQLRGRLDGEQAPARLSGYL